MSEWTDERNRNMRILRALVLDTPERKAAVAWAVRRLEGAPENWVALDLLCQECQDSHRASPGPDRWKERSRTYPAIAEAMAHQWGRMPTADKANGGTEGRVFAESTRDHDNSTANWWGWNPHG